jgi:hypothetical protein
VIKRLTFTLRLATNGERVPTLASLLVFLALMLFMFRAGYEWRKLESRTREDSLLDSLVRKI